MMVMNQVVTDKWGKYDPILSDESSWPLSSELRRKGNKKRTCCRPHLHNNIFRIHCKIIPVQTALHLIRCLTHSRPVVSRIEPDKRASFFFFYSQICSSTSHTSCLQLSCACPKLRQTIGFAFTQRMWRHVPKPPPSVSLSYCSSLHSGVKNSQFWVFTQQHCCVNEAVVKNFGSISLYSNWRIVVFVSL